MDLYQSTHYSLVLVVLFEATVRFCFHVQLDLLRLVDSEPGELRAQISGDRIWTTKRDNSIHSEWRKSHLAKGEKCFPSRDVPTAGSSLVAEFKGRCRSEVLVESRRISLLILPNCVHGSELEPGRRCSSPGLNSTVR